MQDLIKGKVGDMLPGGDGSLYLGPRRHPARRRRSQRDASPGGGSDRPALAHPLPRCLDVVLRPLWLWHGALTVPTGDLMRSS